MGPPIPDLEVQNKSLKTSKVIFEVQKLTFECVFKTKMLVNNILEVPAVIPASFSYTKYVCFFERKSMNTIPSQTINMFAGDPSLLSPLGGLLVRYVSSMIEFG